MSRCKNKTVEGRVCKNKRCSGLNVCNVHAKECSVCFEKTTTGGVCTLSCGHSFHNNCIGPWFEQDHRCPYCRTCVRRPRIKFTFNSEIVNQDTINTVRAMARVLYDSGRLPDVPLYVDYRNNTLAIIDLENDTVVAQI
jgi:hypothetical protein